MSKIAGARAGTRGAIGYRPEYHRSLWTPEANGLLMYLVLMDDEKALRDAMGRMIKRTREVWRAFARTPVASESQVRKCMVAYKSGGGIPEIDLVSWRRGDEWTLMDRYWLYRGTSNEAVETRSNGAHRPSYISRWLGRTTLEVKEEMLRISEGARGFGLDEWTLSTGIIVASRVHREMRIYKREGSKRLGAISYRIYRAFRK